VAVIVMKGTLLGTFTPVLLKNAVSHDS
jgi:hypothetical protein